ncbi:hypothetical protein KCU93_g3504, partial [Aureobasidium melanogenum]
MESLHAANGFKKTILQRQYRYFKDRPGETLIGTRVKLMTLKPDDFASKSNHEQGDWDSLDAPDDISTENYLKYHVEEKLRSPPVGDSLQICFLILEVGTTQHQLSFWHSAIETFLTYRGRRMPTRSKIQYLIHLDDCRRLAISDLEHGKTVVDEARLTVKMVDFCCKKKGGPDEAMAIKTFSSFHEDFDFLIMKFETLKTTLATAREQINEQMSLAQGERALILTIAAAFFIPLSFIASIFGMNVKEPLFPPSKPKHASKTTTTTHTISSTPTASVDPSQPSQHYWTMSQYLEISLPLTVGVILLPLIAGPWLRLASQQYDVNRRHWRALFVVFSACYFVGLFVTFYIGSIRSRSENYYYSATYYEYIATLVYLAAGYSVTAVIGIARTGNIGLAT